MNFAHIHLILNHLPIIGIPIALLFLVRGIWAKSLSTQRFSLLVLSGLALLVLPVYLTGEPAEKVIEHLPGFTEAFIEPHEEAAQLSLILTLLTGAAAFFAFWLQKRERWRSRVNLAVIGIAITATISLLYTANLGGQVRHTELRSGATDLSPKETNANEKEDHD
jgi:formate hydrogenlyase subunit 3/multisubunit Na+/H+ antiporter MnhD subunit